MSVLNQQYLVEIQYKHLCGSFSNVRNHCFLSFTSMHNCTCRRLKTLCSMLAGNRYVCSIVHIMTRSTATAVLLNDSVACASAARDCYVKTCSHFLSVDKRALQPRNRISNRVSGAWCDTYSEHWLSALEAKTCHRVFFPLK